MLIGLIEMKVVERFINKLIHNNLLDIQGGVDGEYYHLTYAEWKKIPTTPYIVSPMNDAININQAPLIQGSEYIHPYEWIMHEKEIKIAIDENFENIVYENLEFSENVGFQIPLKEDETSYLQTNTTYYCKIRYKDKNGGWSNWSNTTRFTTMQEFLDNLLETPIMTIPTNGGIVRSKDPIFAMSSGKTLLGVASFESANWQISNNPDFSPILYEAYDTPSTTMHQADGLELTSANSVDFYVRAQQKTSNGEFTPWSIPVRFGIRPAYEDLVFGMRRIFSKINGPMVFQLDAEGNIISIPTSYFNKHPLYQFPLNEIFVGNSNTTGTPMYSIMAYCAPCWIKHNVYDNDDGDMVIDMWFSPTPQTGNDWILHPAFAQNENGFLHGVSLLTYLGPYDYFAYSNPINSTSNTMDSTHFHRFQRMYENDPTWHVWTIYERMYLMDLMAAEYTTLDASKISTNTGLTPFSGHRWRQFSGLCNVNDMYIYIFGIKPYLDQDTNYTKFVNIGVSIPNSSGSEVLIPVNIYRTALTGPPKSVARGYDSILGFDRALLGIVTEIDNESNLTYGVQTNPSYGYSFFLNKYGSISTMHYKMYGLASAPPTNNTAYYRFRGSKSIV